MHSTYKIKIICNRLSSSACFRHGYSTFASSCSPVAGAEFQQISSFVMAHTRPIYAPVVLLRRFTAATSCSEHMSHIKQLREITGAPMKDVKAALVDFSWDIEAALKELWRRGLVLASKNPFRTAAKGWLALAQNDSKAAVIELNCETDQITKNETFQHLLLGQVLAARGIEPPLRRKANYRTGWQSSQAPNKLTSFVLGRGLS